MSKPELLIDKIYRATFRNPREVFMWRSPEQLRQMLLQARRFVLDDEMSAFLAHLACAAFKYVRKSGDADIDEIRVQRENNLRRRAIEQMRVSARTPFEIVWIEFNFRRFAQQSDEITGLDSCLPETPNREGWLIWRHPRRDTAMQIQAFADAMSESDVDAAKTTSPVGFGWTVDDSIPPWPTCLDLSECDPKTMFTTDAEVACGLSKYKTEHVVVCHTHLIARSAIEKAKTAKAQWLHDAVLNHAGILRRVWALLATIDDIPVLKKDVSVMRGFVAKGRYRRFLCHSTITLHIPEKRELQKLARQLIAIARRRAHEVRGHWRNDWRNPGSRLCKHEWQVDQTCALCHAHRIWIHEHQRGDASLGLVVHDYLVSHESGDAPE